MFTSSQSADSNRIILKLKQIIVYNKPPYSQYLLFELLQRKKIIARYNL